MFYIIFGQSSGAATSSANISAHASDPTVSVGGTPVAGLYGPIWADSTKHWCFAAYMLLNGDGSVRQLTSGDVVTYSIGAGAFTTGLGASLAETDAAVTNYVGRYVAGYNGCTSFEPNPTMPVGYDSYGGQTSDTSISVTRNARLRFAYMSGVTYDSATLIPKYFTPGVSQSMTYWSTTGANKLDSFQEPMGQGVYTLQIQRYKRPHAGSSSPGMVVGQRQYLLGCRCHKRTGNRHRDNLRSHGRF